MVALLAAAAPQALERGVHASAHKGAMQTLCKRMAGMALYWLQAVLACALLAAAAAQRGNLAPLNMSLRATGPRSAQAAPAQLLPAGSMSQAGAPAHLVRAFIPLTAGCRHPVTSTNAARQACYCEACSLVTRRSLHFRIMGR